MLVYSALFDVSERLSIEEFIDLAIEWVSNPRSVYDFPEFEWDGSEEFTVVTNDKRSEFTIYVLIEKNTVAINLKTTDQYDTKWENYYSLVDNKLYVKLEKHLVDINAYITKNFYTPYLLKQLYKNDYILKEKPELTNDSEYSTLITTQNYSIVKNIIMSGNDYRLPVVYITKFINGPYQNSYPIDTYKLSIRLLGIAHVLKEDVTDVSQLLKEETQGVNPYNGAIQVFFANNYSKRFLPSNYSNSNLMINDIFKILFERNLSVKVDNKFSLLYISREIYKIQIKNLETKEDNTNNMENELILNRKRIKELENELDKEKSNLYSNDIKIKEYESKLNERADIKPLFDVKDINELYEGEIFDCIFDILGNVLKNNVGEESRTYQILSSILQKNNARYNGKRKYLQKEIRKIIQRNSKLSNKDISDLKKLGLEITGESHYIVNFHGGTQKVTLAKTPSDKVHGNKNSCNQLLKKLF